MRNVIQKINDLSTYLVFLVTDCKRTLKQKILLLSLLLHKLEMVYSLKCMYNDIKISNVVDVAFICFSCSTEKLVLLEIRQSLHVLLIIE